MPTFPEQDSLVRWEFALNGELQQVVPTSSVLLILFISTKPSQFPELCSRPRDLPFYSGPLSSLNGSQFLCSAGNNHG